MKCPKCGYISFDYNHTCPKCNKNISPEREKMNLPDYRPNPPFLLGTLLDGTRTTGPQPEGGTGAYSSGVGETSFSADDSEAIEAIDEAFEDSQDMDIQLTSSPDIELEDTIEPIDLATTMEGAGPGSLNTEDVELDVDHSTRDFGGTLDGEPSVVGEMSSDDFEIKESGDSEEIEQAEIFDSEEEEPADTEPLIKGQEIDQAIDSLGLNETSDFELEAEPGAGEKEKPKEAAADKEELKADGTLSLDLDSIDLDLDLEGPGE
jgi:hypothetical protein